jgi:hypothetical protein
MRILEIQTERRNMTYRKICGKWVKPASQRRRKYKAPPSPSRRETPWVTLTIRAEHYAMLRELAEYHQCTISAAAMALIQEEFIRQVAETDPEKARKLEEEYGPQYKHA